MDIKELKKSIENNTLDDSSIVFVCESKFIPFQYIQQISKNKNKKITHIDDLSGVIHRNPFLTYSDLYVYITDKLEIAFNLDKIKNLYIICKKCLDNISNVVSIPKLEDWQIKDYIYSNLEDFSSNNVDELFNICNKDIYRIDIEISRLKLFPNSNNIFNSYKEEGVYSDLSDKNIFDFINAIENKNKNILIKILKEKNAIDVEPLGVVTLLYNAFRKMLIINTTKYPDEKNTGIKSNQIWALKKISEKYSVKEILNIFKLLCTLQERLVLGEIPEDLLIDYILIHIFS